MQKKLVFIIILNWNGYEDTLRCLGSISKNKYKNYQVIVVDNASTDKSREYLKVKYPDLKILEEKSNNGYSHGNNIGIKYALKNRADFVLLLNNDTIVDPNFLIELVKSAQSRENIGIVSPAISLMDKPKVFNSCGGIVDWKIKYPFILYRSPKYRMKQYDVDYVSGCCLLVKRNVFSKIGYLDEDYFMYMEDNDFSYRVKAAGFSIMVNPKSKIWHAVSKITGGEGNPFGTYYMNRNKFLFARKNIPAKLKFFLWSSLYEMKMFTLQKKYKKAWAVFFGTIDGLIGQSGKSYF